METKEIVYSEKVEIPRKEIKGNELTLESGDLPIIINYEGRKKYILKKTKYGCLLLDKKIV